VLLLHEFEFELLLVQSGKRSCFSVSTSDSGSLLGSCPAKLWGLGDIGGIDEETVEPVCEASSDVSTLILLKADSVHEFELDSAGEDRRQWLPLLLLLGELKGSGVSGCDTLATTLEFLTRSKRSGVIAQPEGRAKQTVHARLFSWPHLLDVQYLGVLARPIRTLRQPFIGDAIEERKEQ